MPITSDERHAQTLSLLNEVLAYLDRLPHVPITSAFIARIRKHLDDPAINKLDRLALERRGDAVDAAGRVLVRAVLKGDALTLFVPRPIPEQLSEAGGVLVNLALAEPVSAR
ncbi:hypothetical protein [Pollutimonas bauzanensis]|uniref:Uncharacterized protein n=1 Tax=Pollutimonas bauzanensis TaxID=658167 RepID=A0A1M5YJ93_9BURK|nr:hypothetical protein [Pollutimonas bauzanensis]SHI12086.1 hypothetical protein SAMN04488135_109148 [Pollutimonas bauzanensis]